MNKLLLFLTTILLLSCNAEKTRISEAKDSDSTFVDFFEKFMWEEDFQKSRIIFPFNQNGIEIKTSEEWNYLPFYTQSAYIPTLTSDTIDIFDKKVNLESIEMYIIDFEKDFAESYLFEKVKKNWHLKNFEKTTFVSLPDPDFIKFLIKFSRDSIFQLNSISFPITELFADPDNDYETAFKIIKEEEWEFWKLTDGINRLFLLSEIQKENKYRNIYFRGVENGIWTKYTFERINGDWKLIKLEDYST